VWATARGLDANPYADWRRRERGHIFNYIIIRGAGGDGEGAALGGLAFDGEGARMGVADEFGEAGAPGGQTLF